MVESTSRETHEADGHFESSCVVSTVKQQTATLEPESPFDEPPVLSSSAEESPDDREVLETLSLTPCETPIPEITAIHDGGSTIESLTHASGYIELHLQRQQERRRHYGGSMKKKRTKKRKGETQKHQGRPVSPVPEVPVHIDVEKKKKKKKSRRGRERTVEQEVKEDSFASYSCSESNEDQDEEPSDYCSQETSLELLLSREWLLDDAKSTGTSLKDTDNESSCHDDDYDLCGTQPYLCFLFEMSDFSSKPFMVPVSWKEYTTLETECVQLSNVPMCREESWIKSETERQQQYERQSSSRSVYSGIAGTLQDLSASLQSCHDVMERFLEGPDPNNTTDDKLERTDTDTFPSTSSSNNSESLLGDQILVPPVKMKATAE